MFMSKILSDDETAEGINWLNAKKRKVLKCGSCMRQRLCTI